MNKKLLAALTAAVMSMTMLPVGATAEDAIVPVAYPDWIPQTFEDAVNFCNTYGATHVEDGYVGAVYREYKNENTSYQIGSNLYLPDDDSEQPADTPDVVIPATELLHLTLENDLSPYQYEVVLYLPTPHMGFGVYFTRLYNNVPYNDGSYLFLDDGTTAYENDLYSWLPDCITEYNAFVEQYGAASVQHGYIVHCADVNYSTGATLQVEQSGTAEVEKVLTSDCSQVYGTEAPVGNASHFIELYRPASDGTVEMTWTVGREWDPDPTHQDSVTEKTYEISNNGDVIRDVTDGASVPGDVDSDGRVGVTDVILLQKWLVQVPDTVLTDPAAADLNSDGTVDIFDLALLKHALTITPPAAEETVLLCEGDRVGYDAETGWIDTPYSRTITREALAEYPEIIAALDKVIAKEDALQETAMQGWNWGVDDYGQDYLYLPGTHLLLAKFGSETGWLADEDVQELTARLIAAGFFGDAELAKAYIMNKIIHTDEDTPENRSAAKTIGEYALARLQDGTYTLETEIRAKKAADYMDAETAALFDPEVFLWLGFKDEHTVHLMLNAGLLDAYGYLVTDGTVTYEVGDEVPVPGCGFDGGLVRIDAAEGNVYHYYAGT